MEFTNYVIVITRQDSSRKHLDSARQTPLKKVGEICRSNWIDIRFNHYYDSNLIQYETGIYTNVLNVVAGLSQFLPEIFFTQKHFPPLL